MPVSTDDLDDMLTVAEAAAKLRVTDRHLRRIIAAGGLETFRPGIGRSRIYITHRSLTEYINQHTNRAQRPPRTKRS